MKLSLPSLWWFLLKRPNNPTGLEGHEAHKARAKPGFCSIRSTQKHDHSLPLWMRC